MRHPHIFHLGEETQGKSRLSPSPSSNEETLILLGVQAEAWTGTERAWHLEWHSSLPLPISHVSEKADPNRRFHNTVICEAHVPETQPN